MRVARSSASKQHGARGAQVGVERVVPLLLARELLGREVGRGLGFSRFGRELGQALRRRGEPRRQIGDRPLQGEAERIVLGAQALQVGVGEVLVPERRFDRRQGRARLIEIERMGVLRPRPARAPERTKARKAQHQRRNADGGFIAGKMALRGDSAARS